MTETDRVLIFDVDDARAERFASALGALGLSTDRCAAPERASEALRRGVPDLAVVVDPDGSSPFDAVVDLARRQGVSTLAVIEPGPSPSALVPRVRGFDAWVAIDQVDRELPARAVEALEKGRRRKAPPVDPRFLALVVHDIRTPLNVIWLTLPTMARAGPGRGADFEEDMAALRNNSRQIAKLLAHLADYCRLIEGDQRPSAVDFDPKRFLADVLDDEGDKPVDSSTKINLESDPTSPAVVALDPTLAKKALQYAMANAATAAGGSPLRLRSSGRPGWWKIEVVVDQPPPPSVEPADLRPDKFERLAGSVGERRGLDLAMTARISEMLGGSARLEVEPGRGSTIVMEWPERPPGR